MDQVEDASAYDIGNYFIDFFFLLDLISNFFTTTIDPVTGQEIDEKSQIACPYLKFQFWIDFVSTVPFDAILGLFMNKENVKNVTLFSICKIIRIFRLEKIISAMTSTEDVKLTLRLFKLCAIIIIYIHLTSCLFFWLAKIDSKWMPNQYVYYGETEVIFN